MAEADGLLIRDATDNDEAAWRRLWSGYNSFYKADVPEAVTAQTWARILDPDVSMFARMAEIDGEVVGFTISVLHPSTWARDLDCYLEDLFVAGDARGRGVGRALLDDLLRLAKARGWSRLYWHTNAGNEAARRLYDQYAQADDFVRYRLTLDT